jgi:hypothetical protein
MKMKVLIKITAKVKGEVPRVHIFAETLRNAYDLREVHGAIDTWCTANQAERITPWLVLEMLD